MSIIGDIVEDSNEKTQVFLLNDFDEKIGELRNISIEIDYLDDLVEGLIFLRDSDYYVRLMDVYGLKGRIYESGVKRGDFYDSPLIKVASKYLYKPSFMINLKLFKNNTLPQFWTIYEFFEYLYYMNTNKALNVSNMLDIYRGDLVARVIMLLDNFDDDSLELTSGNEFFKNLQMVKWERQSKRLNKRMESLLGIVGRLNGHSWNLLVGEELIFYGFFVFVVLR